MSKLVTLLSVLILVACDSEVESGKKPNQRIYGRKITYKVKVDHFSDTLAPYIVEYTKQKFGDSVTVYYDDKGNFFKEYHGSGSRGYDYNIYHNGTNSYYSKWKNLDTLYYYELSENTLELDEVIDHPQELVSGIDCQKVEYKGISKSLQQQDNYYVNLIWYFNTDTLKINPRLFKNYKEFFFSDFMEKSEAIYVKSEMKTPEYWLTNELIRVDNNWVIDSTIFEPSTKGVALKFF